MTAQHTPGAAGRQVQALANISETVLGHLRDLQDVPGSSHQREPSQRPDIQDPGPEDPDAQDRAGLAPGRDTV